MIKKDVELNISKDGTKITLTKPLVLHKGDENVCLDLHIIGADYDFHRMVETDEVVGESVMAEINVLKPSSEEFQFRADILEGNIIHFEVPSTLVDDYAEVGIHLLQIVVCYGITSRLALPTIQMTVKDRFDLDTINTMPVTPQIVTEINKIVDNKMRITNGAVDNNTRQIGLLQEDMNNKADADHDHDEVYVKKSEKITMEQMPQEVLDTMAEVKKIRFVDQLPPKEEQKQDVIYFVVG